jgi:hypothetical protein
MAGALASDFIDHGACSANLALIVRRLRHHHPRFSPSSQTRIRAYFCQRVSITSYKTL